ncbi:50S ribosomal protein L4 [Candidatus Pacearchaeota archaeon]|nr:50S ribosomal protein L4 [Candidatus Pacearchaeota archaeon]
MKLAILNKEGKKIKEIQTKLFEEPIREDIIRKVVEAERIWHPYSTKLYAGMNRSASGKVRHKRHSWKSDRGRGMSRIPKKAFWRRGTQFSWEGAIVPSTRGGRRAHPPKLAVNLKKINKKEYKKALLSTLTYISSLDEIKKKYASLKDKEINIKMPLILDNEILSLKAKEFIESLKKIFNGLNDVIIQKKTVRAGKGKMRGRKYKKNAGLLFVIGKNEKIKFKGIGIIKSDELTVSDLAENGARITAFSENAVQELENFLFSKKDKTNENVRYKKENKIQKKSKENFERIGVSKFSKKNFAKFPSEIGFMQSSPKINKGVKN